MRRLVVISPVPLNISLIRFYYLDFLQSSGVPVEFWDISSIFGALPHKEAETRPYAHRLASFSELEAACRGGKLKESLTIMAFAYEPRSFRIYQLLSRSAGELGWIESGVMPSATNVSERGLRNTLRIWLRPRKIASAVIKRAAIAARRAGLIRGFDVVFTAGSAAQEGQSSNLVPINYCDYDDWLETQHTDERLVSGQYAVYLDQYAPHHPDLLLSGIERLIDPDRYYRALNGFFALLEARHRVEVVIAAHPKATYSQNPFDGRRIFWRSTRQLSRFCEFAINNSSTSMSYPILDYKPIAFFTTDEIARFYAPIGLDSFPSTCALMLGQTCVNIDHSSRDQARIETADRKRYDAYKYRYLASSQTEGRLSREIFLDWLRKPSR